MLFRRQGPPVPVTLIAHGEIGGTPASFELHDLDQSLLPDEVIVLQCQGGGIFKCRMSKHENRCEVLATRSDTDVESCWNDVDP